LRASFAWQPPVFFVTLLKGHKLVTFEREQRIMRKLAALFGTACLIGATGIAHAGPVASSATLSQHHVRESGVTLLSRYEHDGLVLTDNVQTGSLSIQADPAAIQVMSSGESNRYRLAMRDILSAAATYAYLYFGQHPEKMTLVVTADVQRDGFSHASASTGADGNAGPALTMEIARPSFPISADSQPDAYSAQTIGMILDQIDISKVNMAPWLRSALKKQAVLSSQ
jgi:hypothetical protein